jgi:hypothetical protein
MKEMQKNLLSRVGERLAKFGFKAKPAEQAFVRIFLGGKQSFHLAFIEHATDFDVTADIAIRFDALEDLINATNSFLSKKLKANTYSIGCELGNLALGEQHRWSVISTTDVDVVASNVVNFFERYGLPYFEKYSTLESVFNLICPNPEKPSLHSPLLDQRAKSAVGLALLLNRSEEIPKLIADYESQMRVIYPPGLQGFIDFVATTVPTSGTH